MRGVVYTAVLQKASLTITIPRGIITPFLFTWGGQGQTAMSSTYQLLKSFKYLENFQKRESKAAASTWKGLPHSTPATHVGSRERGHCQQLSLYCSEMFPMCSSLSDQEAFVFSSPERWRQWSQLFDRGKLNPAMNVLVTHWGEINKCYCKHREPHRAWSSLVWPCCEQDAGQENSWGILLPELSCDPMKEHWKGFLSTTTGFHHTKE